MSTISKLGRRVILKTFLGTTLLLGGCSHKEIHSEQSLVKVFESKQRYNTNLIPVYYMGDSDKARHFVIQGKEYKVAKGAFQHIEVMPFKHDEDDWKVEHFYDVREVLK